MPKQAAIAVPSNSNRIKCFLEERHGAVQEEEAIMYLERLERIDNIDVARLAGRAAGWVQDASAARLWQEANASSQLPRLSEEADLILSRRE